MAQELWVKWDFAYLKIWCLAASCYFARNLAYLKFERGDSMPLEMSILVVVQNFEKIACHLAAPFFGGK